MAEEKVLAGVSAASFLNSSFSLVLEGLDELMRLGELEERANSSCSTWGGAALSVMGLLVLATSSSSALFGVKVGDLLVKGLSYSPFFTPTGLQTPLTSVTLQSLFFSS